ncbi:MAG: GTP-binding protein [Polyangiales bacterium]
MATERTGRSLPHGNLALIGHADHGKTELLRALSRRLAERPDGYARPPAPRPEVLGHAPSTATRHARMTELETSQRHWSVLDVPGRRQHLREAIREMACVDVAVLVVSAVVGAEPQTREHLLHARGAPNLVVFLNRCDEVTEPDWIDEVERDVRQVIASCDLPGDDVPVLRGSALRAADGDARWTPGVDALIDALDRDVALPTRDDEGPGILLVKASYRRLNRGVIAAGVVLRGTLSVNRAVEVVGRGPVRRATPDRMEIHGRPVASARAGDSVGVMLRDLERPWRAEGAAVATPGAAKAALEVSVRLRALTKREGGRHTPMLDGHRMQLCVGAAKVPCALRLPDGVAELAPGDEREVTLALDTRRVYEGTWWRTEAIDHLAAWAEVGMRVALRDGSHGIAAADGALVWGGTCAVGTVTAVTHAG